MKLEETATGTRSNQAAAHFLARLAQGWQDGAAGGHVPVLEDATQYEVLAKLGSGGAGAVYRARHQVMAREVALKIVDEPTSPARRDAWSRRFLREARVLARLDHPHIVRIHEAFMGKGRAFIAMELIAGETLRDRLARQGPFAPEDALALVEKLARALAHAHEQGVLHRDMKPDNVMIGADGEPRIVDFGLARSLEPDRSRLTKLGSLVGTPQYFSPEQARGEVETLDARTDVWALGVILYELLSGKTPFRDEQLMALLQKIQDATPAVPSTSEAGRIALWALEKAPEKRPRDARELADACAAARASMRPAAVAPASAPAPSRQPIPIAVVVPGILLLGIGIGIGLALGGSAKTPAIAPSLSPSPSLVLADSPSPAPSPSPLPSVTPPPLVVRSPSLSPSPSSPVLAPTPSPTPSPTPPPPLIVPTLPTTLAELQEANRRAVIADDWETLEKLAVHGLGAAFAQSNHSSLVIQRAVARLMQKKRIDEDDTEPLRTIASARKEHAGAAVFTLLCCEILAGDRAGAERRIQNADGRIFPNAVQNLGKLLKGGTITPSAAATDPAAIADFNVPRREWLSGQKLYERTCLSISRGNAPK